MVNMGVRAFNTPVTELSNCVCAVAKRKEGIRLPTKPTEIRYFHSSFLTLFNLFNAMGNKKREAATIRRDPTSPELKVTKPLFIKINELPQIRESTINKVQESSC